MTACRLFVLMMSLFLFSHPVEASLKKADIQILQDVYASWRYTFFCHQAFTSEGMLVIARCKTCPSQPLPIKWMPIVPLRRLAAHLTCYHDKRCIDNRGRRFGGIKCCEKTDPQFNLMSHDLRNYVPENPILQKMRGHLSFEDFSPLTSSDSGCHFYIDNKNKRMSPAPTIRGFIARTYLYMHHRYQMPLSDKEYALYTKWDDEYPLSDWERKREQLFTEKIAYAFKKR